MEKAVYKQILSHEANHWWYRGMFALCLDELRRRVFSRSFAARAPRAILDVGCGTGFWTEKIVPYGRVAALDNTDEALSICRGRGLKGLMKGSADNLPIRDESCALVTGLGVIEHLDKDRNFLREVRRVLEPGGHALLLTSSYAFLWSEHDEAAHHKRRYTRPALGAMMSEEGLEIVRATYTNAFLFLPILLVRLIRAAARTHHTAVGESADLEVPPPLVNELCYGLLRLEARLLRWMSLPFGVNIVVLVRKKR